MNVVGFSGHQDLGGRSIAKWVAEQLGRALLNNDVRLGITSLAVGADQLFARKLIELNIPYRAVIPCQEYQKTFARKDLVKFRRLIAGAESRITLPFVEPSEEAFYQAGKRIVDEATLLISVWNGLPARGLGGTADIVSYALGKNRPVIQINPVERSAKFL